jgi:hypothetical protein
MCCLQTAYLGPSRLLRRRQRQKSRRDKNVTNARNLPHAVRKFITTRGQAGVSFAGFMGTLRLGCALLVLAAAGCGSYVKHDDSGPPPLPKGSATNAANTPHAGSDASGSTPATMMTMMIATGSAGMKAEAAGMSATGSDDHDEAGYGGATASAAVSGNAEAGSGGAGSGAGGHGASAGGAAGASGRAGAGGRGGASGDDGDDQNPDGTTDRDVTGPCRDLDLFCLDDLDMFLLNPECFTCNSGMGCQSCEFFRAI